MYNIDNAVHEFDVVASKSFIYRFSTSVRFPDIIIAVCIQLCDGYALRTWFFATQMETKGKRNQ